MSHPIESGHAVEGKETQHFHLPCVASVKSLIMGNLTSKNTEAACENNSRETLEATLRWILVVLRILGHGQGPRQEHLLNPARQVLIR